MPLLLLLVCLTVFKPTALADPVSKVIETEVKKRQIPGLAYAVVGKDGVLKSGAFGYADLQTGTRATVDSVFEIASLTKQFTATAILMLVEKGKIILEAPITNYLKDAPEKWKPIKVHHLLTHTSGLPEIGNELQSIRSGGLPFDLPTQQIYESAKTDPIDSAPGERWAYSDLGYLLLGLIIENTSGQSYPEFLHHNIFGPLGMEDTRVLDQWEIVPRRAQNYLIRDGKLVRSRREWELGIKSHYGVLSTINDLIKYEYALRSRQLLPKSLYQKMWTQVTLTDGTKIPYGFGWVVDELRGHPVIEHTGITGTAIYRLPQDDITVLVLGNLSGLSASNPAGIAHLIASFYVDDLSRPEKDLPTIDAPRLKLIVDRAVEQLNIPGKLGSEEDKNPFLPAAIAQDWPSFYDSSARWSRLWVEDVAGVSKRFAGGQLIESKTVFLMEGARGRRYWQVAHGQDGTILGIRVF